MPLGFWKRGLWLNFLKPNYMVYYIVTRVSHFWKILDFQNPGWRSLIKSKVEISQNFVAFSEYMNFTTVFTGLPIHLAQQVPPTTASTVVGGCPIKLRAISISSNSNSANQWTNLTNTFSNPHTLANHCRMIHPADFRRKSTLKFHPIPILQEGTVIQNQ